MPKEMSTSLSNSLKMIANSLQYNKKIDLILTHNTQTSQCETHPTSQSLPMAVLLETLSRGEMDVWGF